ncbi:arginine-binding periplasmic protein-like [Ptychodera flava]|uniref:arginine-binding periplasmic protein-like n=1 Tax=Ptychodera flava TaxID=63121 RepID=UPI00396A9FA5
MFRLSCAILLGFAVVAVNSTASEPKDEQDAETPPILKLLLMKQLFGAADSDGQGLDTLGRALRARHVPPPLLRAVFMQRLGAAEASQASDSPLRKLLLLRLVGKQMGEKLISEIKRRKEEARIYTFQTTLLCDCAMEYVDDDGKLAGFFIDLVHAVCEAAKKQCRIMYDASSNCYTHHVGEHSRIGPGLLGKNYDACLGWMETEERGHSVGFTDAFWDDGNEAHFYVKAGNPKGFDPDHVEGKSIGFVDGWVSDKSCLQHHYGQESVAASLKPHTEYISDSDKLFEQLEDETLDSIFVIGAIARHAEEHGFERVGGVIHCGTGLYHAITRKDSHLPEWFDETLAEMKENGQYYSVCHKAVQLHGKKGEVKCVTP